MNAVVEVSSKRTSLVQRMADRFGVDADKMMATLKATAFKGEVSNEQMMALLVVAEQYSLNPWTKEIYAFPDKNHGIVPVVGVDGWARIINERTEFDGMDFEEADDGAWIKCTIHRKDRSHPISVKEWLSECKRDTGPWRSHPRRMLRHKAMIQCARVAFGFAGIYDQDEAERIREVPINVTPMKQLPPKPANFDNWLADMEAVADTGPTPLTQSWENSAPELRSYLTSTDAARWEAIKAKAARVIE